MTNRKQLSTYKIDRSVVITMIVLIAFSLIILAFRYKNLEPCMGITIRRTAPNYYQGSIISFKAEANKGRSYEWDFSDGSVERSILPSIQHSFKKPGTYIVSLIVNEHCEAFDTVVITKKNFFPAPSNTAGFVGPDTVFVNRPVTFSDTSSDAISWEWRFGETENVDGTTRKASYTFRTPGNKVVYLEINGRSDRVAIRNIYVKEVAPLVKINPEPRTREPRVYKFPDIQRAPSDRTGMTKTPEEQTVQQTPPPKVYPDIQADEMVMLIKQVVNGEKKPEDFAQYFCDDPNIPVTYNGTGMKFNQMCYELRKHKKAKNIHTPEVQLIKNSSSNCIRSMIVKVQKQSFFDRVF